MSSSVEDTQLLGAQTDSSSEPGYNTLESKGGGSETAASSSGSKGRSGKQKGQRKTRLVFISVWLICLVFGVPLEKKARCNF